MYAKFTAYHRLNLKKQLNTNVPFLAGLKQDKITISLQVMLLNRLSFNDALRCDKINEVCLGHLTEKF